MENKEENLNPFNDLTQTPSERQTHDSYNPFNNFFSHNQQAIVDYPKPVSTNPFDESNLDNTPLIPLKITEPDFCENDFVNLALIPVGKAGIPILIQEKENIDNISSKLSDLAWQLKPTHSLWDSIVEHYRKSGLAGKLLGGTMPGLSLFSLGILKLAGVLAIPSIAAGTGIGLGIAWMINWAMVNDHATNSPNVDPEYQQNLENLGSAMEMVFNRIKELCYQLALENHMYSLELDTMKKNNARLALVNTGSKQELMMLGIIRNHLDEQLQKFVQLNEGLQTDLDKERELAKAGFAELQKQIQQREEFLKAFRLKNKEYELILQDMKLKDESSEKTIKTLQETLKKLVQIQNQDITDKKIVMDKLTNLFDTTEKNMKKICEDMADKNEQYKKNIGIFEENNQKMIETLKQEEAYTAKIEQIMQKLQPETDRKNVSNFLASFNMFVSKPENVTQQLETVPVISVC